MAQWIDTDWDSDLKVGTVGFLVRVQNQNERGMPERWSLRDRPPYTNGSHEPRLTGWCGTTDNRAVYGHGMAKVVRVARNGRALVVSLEGAELSAALEELGFPGLDPASE